MENVPIFGHPVIHVLSSSNFWSALDSTCISNLSELEADLPHPGPVCMQKDTATERPNGLKYRRASVRGGG
ncbi:hypothetical protein Y1Q_0001872 [Alligator mississippiensis]|uniref:Uncharacterized protein n=1 Tax=Alligator mississippiensis TaxID=8496 RepID=A0A151PGA6_ALLMI|nr:hypothetical protein Y1Q_0001872 [Alligator mississippiensis]